MEGGYSLIVTRVVYAGRDRPLPVPLSSRCFIHTSTHITQVSNCPSKPNFRPNHVSSPRYRYHGPQHRRDVQLHHGLVSSMSMKHCHLRIEFSISHPETRTQSSAEVLNARRHGPGEFFILRHRRGLAKFPSSNEPDGHPAARISVPSGLRVWLG